MATVTSLRFFLQHRVRYAVVLFCSVSLCLIAAQATSAEDPPKGEVTKYTFENSKVFPGTVRDYWVYVPKQYDPAKPACVYVNQDGIQYNAPAVFDRLIHEKAMPVVIGVFEIGRAHV